MRSNRIFTVIAVKIGKKLGHPILRKNLMGKKCYNPFFENI